MNRRNDLEARYRIAARKSRPPVERLLVRGFDPWREDCANWRRQEHRALREHRNRLLRRSVWSPAGDPNRCVLVEVRETGSATDAADALLDGLAENEHKRLPDGPNDVGDVCFIHPAGETPAVFWATGNLCLSVVSIGREPVSVLDWARRLDARVRKRPDGPKRDLKVSLPSENLSVGDDVALTVRIPSDPGVGAFLQIFAAGGDLRIEGGEIRVRASGDGPLAVDAYVVASDRPPRAGRIDRKGGWT